jgi:hypothetical protein
VESESLTPGIVGAAMTLHGIEELTHFLLGVSVSVWFSPSSSCREAPATKGQR